MTQQHTEHLVQIFKRLVAAKLTGSLSESARAYGDLDALADHVAIIEEHNGSAAPRPRYGPSARRIEGGAGQRPPMRMLKTKVRPIATGARWAGRPATAVLAYLALKTARPEAGEATVWTKRSVSRFFMICLLPPTSRGTPAFPGSRWGPKIRRFLASVCEKPRTTVCYITSYYKMFYAKWRLTTNAGER